jgi:hypothetical protein
MALIAVCTAKRSPGATVAALAFTLTWGRRILLAECDPAGGDVAAGYLREVPMGDRGLTQLGASLQRRRLAEDLWTQLVDLAPGEETKLTRLLLPGLTNPAHARTWAQEYDARLPTGWQQLAQLFRSMETGTSGYDVIADCGRLAAAHPPTALLGAADVVLLVLRLDLPSIRASAAALASLLRVRTGQVGLITVGEGKYSAKECALELRTAVIAELPDDPGTADVLSNGGEYHRGRLLRAAARTEDSVWQMVNAARDAHVSRPIQAPEVRSVR